MLSAVMLVSFASVISLSVFAEGKSEIAVTWNVGYVGSKTNSNVKNGIQAGSANWIYSDVITIPTAGTKLSFDLTAGYPTTSVWLFSEWKKTGDAWVFDETGAHISGVSNREFIGQHPTAGGLSYEYITDHDNQSIRICLQKTAGNPKVYTEATTDKSTKQQLADIEFTATLTNDGKITGLKWFNGYASSAVNTNGSKCEYKYDSAEYAFSNMFTVPTPGTKITYTISQSTNNGFNAFTRYKLVNGVYVYDDGFDSTDTMVKSGNTYTYVTEKANEVLRICVRPKKSYSTIYVDEPIAVSWTATNEKGTIAKKATQTTEWPAAELISMKTGAPLIGTEVKDLKWVSGYIGSQYHGTASFRYTSPSNAYYYTSDAFNVPKAGTTVYFFDQTFNDFGDSKYASTSALTVSHWTAVGTGGQLNKTKAYFTGCDAYSLEITADYRVYSYTTTEDNEIIRLCLRLAPVFSTEKAIIPPVYLVEPTDFDAEQPESTIVSGTRAAAKLFDGSYTDASGANTEYKYYLPYAGGTADGLYSLVFDNSANGDVAKYLAENAVKQSIVIAYNGSLETSLRLLEEVIEHYPVKVTDIMLIGDDALAAHAKKFETIRLTNTFIYTGTNTLPSFKFAKSYKAEATAEATAAKLIAEYDDYYDVLEGIKMYAIGDSYFGGSGLGQHQTWVNLMGNKYGMVYHNYGIGGNTLAQAEGIGANSPPMCKRYTEMPLDGDIYLLEGGRNDRHYSVPFGTNDDMSQTTLKGAFNIMIKHLREKAPNALIVLVTPWSHKNESGYLGTNDDYANAIRELAEYYNDPHVVCLYAADVNFTGINMSDSACRSKYCLSSSDVSHLNADGMYMVMPKFDKFIAGKFASLNNKTVTNDAEDEEKFITITDTSVTDDTTVFETEPVTYPTDSNQDPDGGCEGCAAMPWFIIMLCGAFALAFVVKKH